MAASGFAVAVAAGLDTVVAGFFAVVDTIDVGREVVDADNAVEVRRVGASFVAEVAVAAAALAAEVVVEARVSRVREAQASVVAGT